MPATDWPRLAKNHLPERDWSELQNVWAAASRGFDPTELTDLSQAIEPIVGADFELRDNVTVFEFHGGHVAAFHNVAATFRKCAYTLRIVGNCLLTGQPTWASVDCYHFSFLACRALLALLGVHFVQVHDTSCILDVFPKGTREQTITRFARANRDVQHPARLIYRKRATIIEQSAAWVMLVRLLNVTSLPQDIERDAQKIAELGDGFGRLRNEVLYRSSSWLYDEDIYEPTDKVAINDDIYSYPDLRNFFGERDSNFAFGVLLVRVLVNLVSSIEASGGFNLVDISTYGTCLSMFTGFDAKKIDTLYATLYRKEAYGVRQ